MRQCVKSSVHFNQRFKNSTQGITRERHFLRPSSRSSSWDWEGQRGPRGRAGPPAGVASLLQPVENPGRRGAAAAARRRPLGLGAGRATVQGRWPEGTRGRAGEDRGGGYVSLRRWPPRRRRRRFRAPSAAANASETASRTYKIGRAHV